MSSPLADIEARLKLHRATTRLMADTLQAKAHSEVFKGEFLRADRLAAKLSYCAYGQRIRRVTEPDGSTRLDSGNRYACRFKVICVSCASRHARGERAKALAMLDEVSRTHPELRAIFLTLTTKNRLLADTKAMLDDHDAGLVRFWRRTAIKSAIVGQIGSIEIAVRGTWEAPEIGVHSHHLALVPPDYFTGRKYLSKADFQAEFQAAARLPYKPIVWVNVPGSRDARSNIDAVRRTVREVVKYCVAPQSIVEIVDHVPTRVNADVILTLAAATHKRRFLRFHGVFFKAAKALRQRKGGAM